MRVFDFFVHKMGFKMQSVYAFGFVVVTAAMLAFCNGDDSDESGNESEYKLKIGGIEATVVTNTELQVAAEIMHDDKLVNEGDVATTEVSLEIKCTDHQIVTQDKAATEGKATFDAIKVEGDKFTGDCTLTVSAKIAGKDVSAEHNFKVVDEAVITLPDPRSDNNGDDSNGGVYVPPIAPDTAIVGRSFVVASPVDLKVQPNAMCEGNLALVYYDVENNEVREVLTAGENIKSVNGVVSGLAVIKRRADVKVEDACQDKDDKSLPPSIVVAVSPGFPQGLRLKISETANSPALEDASLLDDGGKIKLSWSTVSGFESGAEVFFNNKVEGNEWTRHTSNVAWDADKEVVSALAYEVPVKALVMVDYAGSKHWLYFSKLQ